MSQRPICRVPVHVALVLALSLGGHVFFRVTTPTRHSAPESLPAPLPLSILRFASFGDTITLGKALMLYLQAFDFQAGSQMPLQRLDYGRVESWLSRILDLDPEGQYPLMAAARLYAEIPDREKQLRMLECIFRKFSEDPNRRWPWLAHAAVIAKHQRRDLPLARRYAAAIQQHATGEEVPLWARQMEIFILEDMNELETARIMIGGYIEKGLIKHPGELWTMEKRLKEIEARMKKEK